MKSIVYEHAQIVSLKEKELIQGNNVRLRVAYAGICGTDLNIFSGTHPRAKPGLTMGHEFSGTIEANHPTLKNGTTVTVNPLLSCGSCSSCLSGYPHVCETLELIGIDCDGGMATYVDVPAENVVPLPETMSLRLGALTEPVAVTVHTIRQAEYKPGDSVIIFGAGTIGLCLALTLQASGATDIVIVETNINRIEKAKELGFIAINPATESVSSFIKQKTNGAGYDIVFDCAGHPAVLESVFDNVKNRGTIVIIAGYKQPAEVNLLKGMFKELTIRFVRVYTPKDFEIAINLLMTKQSDYDAIITHTLKPEQAADGFKLLTTPSDAVKVVFDFTEETV
ncbi:threonine dehydrogenase [Bacillus sp. JCM 19045]|nr:threonine dehydrogenase [Bacillus sp. JCM 19045]